MALPSARVPRAAQAAHGPHRQPRGCVPRAAQAAARMRPKNVAGADGTAGAATLADVVITSSMIEALRGQPLPAAARAVGVSATSFKRACRRLGLRRWGIRWGGVAAGRTPEAG